GVLQELTGYAANEQDRLAVEIDPVPLVRVSERVEEHEIRRLEHLRETEQVVAHRDAHHVADSPNDPGHADSSSCAYSRGGAVQSTGGDASSFRTWSPIGSFHCAKVANSARPTVANTPAAAKIPAAVSK